MALTRWERKALLRHGAVRDIALETGCTQSHVSQVINDKRRSPRVEAVVARIVGLPVDEVFPAREIIAAEPASAA